MSRQSLEDLKPLLPEPTTSAGSLEKEYPSNTGPKLRGLCRPMPLISLLMVSVLLNITLVVRPIYAGRRQCTSGQILYSEWNRLWIIIEFDVTRNPAPVQDILEYETRLFSRTSDISPYNGPPSEAVDQAWDDMYTSESFPVIALALADRLVSSWLFANS